MEHGKFVHHVFFWLKHPNDTIDRTSFEASLYNFINRSVYIKTKHFGIAAQTERAVIDNSYTYSLLLTFASKKEHDQYQEEPNHNQFIKESSHLWRKVQVYDSVTI